MAHQRARGHRRTAREAVVTIAGVTGNTEARALLWESIAMSAGTNSADGSSTAALEKHYSVSEVCKLWGWSRTKVLEVFRDEPGVLQSHLRTLRPRKRQNVTVRIPESVLLRVHGRLTVGSGR